MKESAERYRITVGDGGLEICDSKGKRLSFTAAEALMLLDILKNEEEKLRLVAEKASPLPVRIRF
jgi:malate/lactate dehydrogenase